MNNASIETRATASKPRAAGIKNLLRIIVAGALLLAAGSAVAGIIFVPVGGRYANPEFAPVQFQDNGSGSAAVRTTGLGGEFTLAAQDVPPEFDPPASGCARLPFAQDLELVVDLAQGTLEGRTRGRISAPDGALDFRGRLGGTAVCVASGGRACGQLLVEFEIRGSLFDANDPARVGLLRLQTLGSLVRVADGAYWAKLDASARLGGDAALIASLTSMEEGESCGI